jgi:predicted Fe-Mo cluster-binding NifX family protein
MKIAVATNGNTLTSPVAQEFEQSTHLLIVDMVDLSFKAFENREQEQGSGMEMARTIKEYDCEAVITGSIQEPAFELLAGEQITRYRGAGVTAQEALEMMERLQLELISDYAGNMGRPHEHGHGHGHSCGGSCDCDES